MKKLFFAIVAALALSSCNTTQSLYSWHDYEDATYQYSKKTTEELQVKMLEQYKKVIEKLFLQDSMLNMAINCVNPVSKQKDWIL